MNITAKQWFLVATGIISGLITGAALLQTLFGQDLTIKIVAVLGLLNIIVSAVAAPFNTQAATVKDVAAMPGVERIQVNENANATLAGIATDGSQKKVLAIPSAAAAVAETAKGG